jgi:hypothetical protein
LDDDKHFPLDVEHVFGQSCRTWDDVLKVSYIAKIYMTCEFYKLWCLQLFHDIFWEWIRVINFYTDRPPLQVSGSRPPFFVIAHFPYKKCVEKQVFNYFLLFSSMASLHAMRKKPFMAAILLFLGLLCRLEHIGLSLSLSL